MSSLKSMQPTLHLVHTLSGGLVQLAALNDSGDGRPEGRRAIASRPS
jgi:hypothetical protein